MVFEGLISFSFCVLELLYFLFVFFLANHRRMNFPFPISQFAF